MSVRRTITIELEVEGPFAEPDRVAEWLRGFNRRSTDFWVVGVEVVEPAVERR